jgi:hypothetical protein
MLCPVSQSFSPAVLKWIICVQILCAALSLIIIIVCLRLKDMIMLHALAINKSHQELVNERLSQVKYEGGFRLRCGISPALWRQEGSYWHWSLVIVTIGLALQLPTTWMLSETLCLLLLISYASYHAKFLMSRDVGCTAYQDPWLYKCRMDLNMAQCFSWQCHCMGSSLVFLTWMGNLSGKLQWQKFAQVDHLIHWCGLLCGF